MEDIQNRRKVIWNQYYEGLKPLADKGLLELPHIPAYAENNAHMFYLVLPSLAQRSKLISYLKENGILSVFHYISLHTSDFYKNKHDGRDLPNSDRYTDFLVRLPMYYELQYEEVKRIINLISTAL